MGAFVHGRTVFTMIKNFNPPYKLGLVLFCLGLLFLTCIMSWNSAAGNQSVYPLEQPDRSSPRATLQTFLDSMNSAVQAFKLGKGDEARRLVEPALECMNLEKEPPALKRFIGLDSALYLKEVLDRVEIPAEQDIPDAKAVAGGTHLPLDYPAHRDHHCAVRAQILDWAVSLH